MTARKPKPRKAPSAPHPGPIELRDPATLTPYAKNHKRHQPHDIDALARQIAAFGFDQPIVVDRTGVIVKGHKRRLAAMQLGLKAVPVWVSDLSKDEALAARIGDNHLITQQFDHAMLQFDLGTLQAHGVDLTLTGMDTELIDAIMGQDDGEPEAPAKPPKQTEQAITVDGQRIPVTDEEVVALRGRLKRYETRHGSRAGFFADLCL